MLDIGTSLLQWCPTINGSLQVLKYSSWESQFDSGAGFGEVMLEET